MGILYGYVRVATKAWWTMPALLLLAVMVPPVIVSFWLRIGRPRLTLARHRAITGSYRYGHEAVDVFLPSCGEPAELLDNTMRCASAMRWQGPKTVYVLDDSAREEVRALAAHYGFRYVVRANRGEMRKAGNLINAFGLSDGEFIVVLDADFAVRPDFLYETMPSRLTRRSGSSRPPSSLTPATGRSPTSSVTRHPPGDLLPLHPRPGTAIRRRSAPGPTWSTGAARSTRPAGSRPCRSVRTSTPA